MKLLSAPSVAMLLVAIVIIMIIALPACFRSSAPAKPKKDTEDLRQFENSKNERKSVLASKSAKRKSQLDPNHITRVARRNNRDGKKSRSLK